MHCVIIPARSGSKGLKDKNVKLLAGKPLMAHTIQSAIASGIFDEIFVSTDSERYAAIAKEQKASVPFLRDKKYATDNASTWAVVKEAVSQYKSAGKIFSFVTLLQPTSPLRTVSDIMAAYEIFIEKKAKAVVSVCKADHSPLWCNVLPSNNSLNGFILPEAAVPRQELSTYYRLNGAIYIIDLKKIDLDDVNLFQKGCYAYIMSKRNSVDIDDDIDFMLAESIMAGGATCQKS